MDQTVQAFRAVLRKDAMNGDIDSGIAESYADLFGFELATRARVLLAIEVEVDLTVNPDACFADLDASDFDVDVSESLYSDIKEIGDITVTSIDVVDIEENE
jgi:hypothetical protein